MTAKPADFRDENGRWKCIGCGACCLPMCAMDPTMKKWDRGDGGCKHLTAEMKCAIYDTRPRNCRSDRFPQISDIRMSRWCARYKNFMDEQIAEGKREAHGKRMLKKPWKIEETPAGKPGTGLPRTPTLR